ncbi:MAG TPA: Hsp20/alpha crystallin family protein [Clostridia bacterium]
MSGFLPWDKNQKRWGMISPFDWADEFFEDFMPAFKKFDSFKIDVKENEKEYMVEAELPGIKKEDVNVSLVDGNLTIAVKNSKQTEEKKENYIYKERGFSTMQRSVYLCNATNEGASAKFEDGILTLKIPKDDSQKIYKIDIN